jgi:hypothetical protein
VHTTRFWNNLHRVCSKSKDWKANRGITPEQNKVVKRLEIKLDLPFVVLDLVYKFQIKKKYYDKLFLLFL